MHIKINLNIKDNNILKIDLKSTSNNISRNLFNQIIETEYESQKNKYFRINYNSRCDEKISKLR